MCSFWLNIINEGGDFCYLGVLETVRSHVLCQGARVGCQPPARFLLLPPKIGLVW